MYNTHPRLLIKFWMKKRVCYTCDFMVTMLKLIQQKTYPSEKCNVETGRVIIHKLEGKKFNDQGIVIFSLGPVVFCKENETCMLSIWLI